MATVGVQSGCGRVCELENIIVCCLLNYVFINIKFEMISIDGFEYRRHCEADDCEMGLLEKLRESFHGRYRDPRAGAMSDRIGIVFFWFITVSEVYVAVQYVVPQQFAGYSEWTRYCLKVACWFVFVQTVANWACIRHCDTSYRVTADQPTSSLTLRSAYLWLFTYLKRHHFVDFLANLRYGNVFAF